MHGCAMHESLIELWTRLRRDRRSRTSWGLCPQTPRVYRIVDYRVGGWPRVKSDIFKEMTHNMCWS